MDASNSNQNTSALLGQIPFWNKKVVKLMRLLLFLKLICASLEMYGKSWHWLSTHYDQMSLHDLSVNLGYGESEKGRIV